MLTPTDFTFDPDRHVYTAADGREIPNVSTILRDVGIAPPLPSLGPRAAVALNAMDRGTVVHKATELHDLRDLDEDSLDDEITEYLDGYKKAVKSMEPWHPNRSPMWIERSLFHPEYFFSGTLDRLWVDARAGGHDTYSLWDIKTGQAYRWHEIQLGAYWLLAERQLAEDGVKEPAVRDGGCLYLVGEKWSLKTHDRGKLARASQIFLSALTIHHWKARR
jgi:hypothetical protein